MVCVRQFIRMFRLPFPSWQATVDTHLPRIYTLRCRFLLFGVWWCYIWRGEGGGDPNDCIVGMRLVVLYEGCFV